MLPHGIKIGDIVKIPKSHFPKGTPKYLRIGLLVDVKRGTKSWVYDCWATVKTMGPSSKSILLSVKKLMPYFG